MVKTSADRFIESHLATFGLMGTNTQHNPVENWPQSDEVALIPFTHNDHFRFGYNGKLFNWRRSSSCMYWADYGQVKSEENNFVTLLINVLKQLQDRIDTLSVVDTGSLNSQLLLATAQKAQVDLKVSTLSIDNELISTPHICGDHHISLSLAEAKTLIDTFCQSVRCANPWLALTTMLCQKTPYVCLLESHLPRLYNQSCDPTHHTVVGPNYWALVEHEEDTAPHRYIASQKLLAIANVFYYTAELMACYIRQPEIKRALLRNNAPVFADTRSQDVLLTKRLLQELEYPIYEARLSEKLHSFFYYHSVELKQKYPKCNEAWITPLHRLAEHWNIHDIVTNKAPSEEFGVVFNELN